jgi:hypothetical protein
MSLLDTILNAQGGHAVQQLGAQLGLGQDQTSSALSAIVPALAAGVQRNAQNSGGLAGLMTALASGQHQKYVNDPSTLASPETVNDGNAILGHIFGSKDVSREVANHAAAQTGVGADVLKRMLPMAAALVMGALARHATSSSSAAPAAPAGSSLGSLGASLSGLAQGGGGADGILSVLASTLGQAQNSGAGGGGIASMLGRIMGG